MFAAWLGWARGQALGLRPSWAGRALGLRLGWAGGQALGLRPSWAGRALGLRLGQAGGQGLGLWPHDTFQVAETLGKHKGWRHVGRFVNFRFLRIIDIP